jgi:hypothetical protein
MGIAIAEIKFRLSLIMHFIRPAFLLCLLLGTGLYVCAQQFGGNPPSIKWRQINTDTVRVIFPVGMERVAREVASIGHKLGATQSTLGNRLRKINVVLQNQTTVSNGYVGLGPFRSEYYLTPQQNSFELGSIPWHHQLALHEFRHVQQFNNFRKGVSKAFYFLAGELGVSFANNTALPSYFWEGDAVYQETLASEQGRGRMPYFFNGFRSLWAAGKNYSWMKLRSGSLRDYVPGHYQLGYIITAYGREKYGSDIWGKITNDAVRFKPLFYPFQGALKRHTGKDYRSFRNDAINFYKEKIGQQEDPSSAWAGKQKHFVGDDEFPQWIDGENLVLVTSSYKRIPKFVKRNVATGAEEVIRTRDISSDNYFSYRNGRIVYAAFDPDTRWGFRDYGEIRLLDINTGGQRNISRKTKYFAPDISADGNRIVAVHVAPNSTYALHILDAANGDIITMIPNKDSLYYTYPKFYGSEHVVSAIRNAKGEMAVGLVSIESGSVEWLTPFSMNVIGFTNVQGDTISFTASSGEQDRLFVIVNKKIYRYTPADRNTATGSYQLDIAGHKTAWVDFTAAGYRLVTGNMAATSLTEISAAGFARKLSVFGITELDKKNIEPDVTAAQSYPVKKYSKAFRLFNFHSWLPTISDPEYSISFLSENILNTLQTDIYFTYNNNEESKKLGFVTAYGGLYPWIRGGVAFTRDRPVARVNNTLIRIDEWEGRAGFVLPLNLTQGRSFSSLRIGSDYVYAKPNITGIYKDTFSIDSYGYLNSYATFSVQSQQARQHIYPRFGHVLQLIYHHGLLNVSRKKILANGYFYLPGAFVNHSLVINAAWQQMDTSGLILYTNSFPFSRGYSGTDFPGLYQEKSQWKLGANYHFPLLYPDWGFGNIVYFLRVRANAFYDFTRASGFQVQTKRSVQLDYRSFGGEVYFDTKWWNQQPVSFGFRYSRLLDGALQGLGANQFEFILPVNLIGR